MSLQSFSRQGNPAGVEVLPGYFQEEGPLLKKPDFVTTMDISRDSQDPPSLPHYH